MKQNEKVEDLEVQLYHEKLTNQILCAENEELRKAISQLYNKSVTVIAPQKTFPSERMRKSIPYRALRKIYRTFIKRGNQ